VQISSQKRLSNHIELEPTRIVSKTYQRPRTTVNTPLRSHSDISKERNRTEVNATEGVNAWCLYTEKWRKDTSVTTMGEAFLLYGSSRASRRVLF
jgi:hypothetical protein